MSLSSFMMSSIAAPCDTFCRRRSSDAATRGDLVCFAVDGDERLTLALMQLDGAWRVQEMRGFANSPPSQRSLERARDVASRWNVGIGGGYQASLFDHGTC